MAVKELQHGATPRCARPEAASPQPPPSVDAFKDIKYFHLKTTAII